MRVTNHSWDVHKVGHFRARVPGSGIWWYWMRRRAEFAPNADVSFGSLAKLYADIDDVNHPAVRNYANAYSTFSRLYFGRRIDADERISLADRSNLWPLAQTMFHHELAGASPN